LHIIEKKMDKGIDSSKLRSHMSHYERIKIISVDMHHHHSPRNSIRRVQSSSSPYSVKNHKRRSGVDEIQGEMNNIKPPTFDGEHKKNEDTKT
jgi:glutaredoxin